MDRENARLRAIFDEAMQLPPDERPRLLAAKCGDDPALQRRIEALLATAESDDPFLAEPTRDNLDTHSSPPLAERPGTRIGPYKLLQQIGEGGFGVVFMAQQDQPVRRRVALKVIKPGMDTRQVVARFEAERQALALMDHPNIAKVLDAGATESGRPFFVMEYVVGDPVTAFADAHRLSVRDRLDLFVQVCQAVQHAHQKGIIHRDLKPRNVLVSLVDGSPFAKVIDFGIAKATGSALTDKTLFTEHRQLIGTPEYMSPEQAEGSPDIDTRTDVYALGVLLYELLAGATPFDAKRLRSAAFAEMQRIIREEDPPLPSVRLSRDLVASAATAAARQAEPGKLGSQVRGELDWIVMKALEKDRGRRYESASQLAFDVQRHLQGETVSAAPPGFLYRLRKLVRRNRAAAVVTGILGLALALGMGGIAWGLKRATDANAELRSTNERIALQRTESVNALANVFTALRPDSATIIEKDRLVFQYPDREDGFLILTADGEDWRTSTRDTVNVPLMLKALAIAAIEENRASKADLEGTNARLKEEARKARLAEASVKYLYWTNELWDVADRDDAKELLGDVATQLNEVLSARVELLGQNHLDTLKTRWMSALAHRFATGDKSLIAFEDVARHLENAGIQPDSELMREYVRLLVHYCDRFDLEMSQRWLRRIADTLPVVVVSEGVRAVEPAWYQLMQSRFSIGAIPPESVAAQAHLFKKMTRPELLKRLSLSLITAPWPRNGGTEIRSPDAVDLQRIITLARQELTTSPDDHHALTALTIATLTLGRFEESLEAIQRASRCLAATQLQLGPIEESLMVLAHQANGHIEDAKAALARLRAFFKGGDPRADEPFARSILSYAEARIAFTQLGSDADVHRLAEEDEPMIGSGAASQPVGNGP